MNEPPPAPDGSTSSTPTTSTGRLSDVLLADWGDAAGRPLLALVFVWVLGLVPALLIWAWGGPGGIVRTPEIAWNYVAAFHGVPLVVTGTGGLLDEVGLGGARFVVFLCPMLGTLAAGALCFHAGRGLARTSMTRADDRALGIAVASASRIALVYALAFLGVSAIARPSFSLGGVAVTALSTHPEIVRAFIAPFLLAFAGALAGASTAVRLRAKTPLRFGAACVNGGACALGVAIAIAACGWGVVALVNPDGTANYARWVADRGPAGGAAVLANQALALPNHGMLVLAPAMGVCDRLSIIVSHRDLLCLRHVPVDPTQALSVSDDFEPGQIPQRPAPDWFLAFLLIPAAGCSIGGVSAARAYRRGGRALGVGTAAILGVGSGLTFAALAGIAALLVSIRVAVTLSSASTTYHLAFGPDPSATAVIGLAWGVVFCTAGALGSALRQRRHAGPGDDQPGGPDANVDPASL